DFPAPWRRDPFDRAAAIDGVVHALEAFASISASPASLRDNLYLDTEPLRRFVRQHLDGAASSGPRDDDALEAALVELARLDAVTKPKVGSGARYGVTATRAAVREAHAAVRVAIEDFTARAGA